MLKCDEAELDLSAYLDGELTPGDRARLEAHLVLCEKCNAILTELEQSRGALQNLERAKAPVGLKARIQNAITETPRVALVAPAMIPPVAVAELPTMPVQHITPAPPVPLRPSRMSWTGLLASCAALLLLGLMIYAASGALDSHMPTASQLSRSKAAATPELSTVENGKRALSEQSSDVAAMKQTDAPNPVLTPQPAGVDSVALANRTLTPKAMPQDKRGANSFAVDKPGSIGNPPVVAINEKALQGFEPDPKFKSKDIAGGEAPVDALRAKPRESEALNSDAVRKELSRGLYDPKLVDVNKALFGGKDEKDLAKADQPKVPALPAPISSEGAESPNRDRFAATELQKPALSDFKKAESKSELAAADKADGDANRPISAPIVSNTAPAPLAPSTTSAPPVASAAPIPLPSPKKPGNATGSKDSSSERLKGMVDDAEVSAGSQARRAIKSQAGGNVMGSQADAGKVAKMQTVILRVENVNNMVDKVQIVAGLHGLFAEIDPAPAFKPAPTPQTPQPPAAVLMMSAPLEERSVVQDLFQLQNTNASVDEIVARNTQIQAKKAKAALPVEKKEAPVPEATSKPEERYLIRVEIYTKQNAPLKPEN